MPAAVTRDFLYDHEVRGVLPVTVLLAACEPNGLALEITTSHPAGTRGELTPRQIARRVRSRRRVYAKYSNQEPPKYLRGGDSLHSTGRMPKGIPVATFAIGEAGAANAGLFAVAIIAGTDAAVARKLAAFRAKQTASARAMRVPPT